MVVQKKKTSQSGKGYSKRIKEKYKKILVNQLLATF